MTAAGWLVDGNCSDGKVDRDSVFFAEDPEETRAVWEPLCARCPVRQVCLLSAMVAEGRQRVFFRFGVFGGSTPAVRAGMFREAGQDTAVFSSALRDELRSWAAARAGSEGGRRLRGAA